MNRLNRYEWISGRVVKAESDSEGELYYDADEADVLFASLDKRIAKLFDACTITGRTGNDYLIALHKQDLEIEQRDKQLKEWASKLEGTDGLWAEAEQKSKELKDRVDFLEIVRKNQAQMISEFDPRCNGDRMKLRQTEIDLKKATGALKEAKIDIDRGEGGIAVHVINKALADIERRKRWMKD